MLSEIILSQTSHFANTDDSIVMKLVSKFLYFVKCGLSHKSVGLPFHYLLWGEGLQPLRSIALDEVLTVNLLAARNPAYSLLQCS